MKKIILLTALVCFVFTVNAQLLVTDSVFNSNDNGNTFNLLATDSSYHEAGNCRLAYAYGKAYDIATQQLTNASYRTYDYFSDGNLRQILFQSWNPVSSSYGNSIRTTLTYYQATSKTLTSLNEIWVNNSAWLNSTLETNTYDANGYLTTSIYQSWDIPSGTWVKDQELDYYNRSNGLVDSSINKEYQSNVLTDQTKNIYSYVGATTMPFRIINQTRVNNQWQDSARSTFTYNAGGRTTTIENEIYSTDTFTWTLLGRQTFAYDANGEISVLTSYLYVLPGFSFITQIRYKHYTCSTVVVTPGELCPNGSGTLTAGSTGATYQWQVSINGGNFSNISNNANYSGTNGATLTLTNIPSTWSGYQYRCNVNGQNGSPVALKFVNKWTGATSNMWNTPSNWSCNTVPDANSDVIITSGTVILNVNNVSVKTLTVSPGASFTANAPNKITITH